MSGSVLDEPVLRPDVNLVGLKAFQDKIDSALTLVG